MPSHRHVEIVRQWVEQVWNAARYDALEQFHPQSFLNHGQPSTVEATRQWHERQHATYADIHYIIDDIFGAADRVAFRWTATATHTGSLWGIVPATGRTITWTGMHIVRIERDRIVDVWALADTVAQLQQMGVTLQPHDQGGA